MLIAVSTIKDTTENMEFFLNENRKSGVDHFFIFFEGELPVDPKKYPFATFISSYKLNPKTKDINRRQRDNANRVLRYLLSKNVEGWITHIDGDEVVNFDKSILKQLPSENLCFKLHSVEPIKSDIEDKNHHTLFKKCLNEEEYSLALSLNLIEKKFNNNRDWLSGHVVGKSVTRIRPKLRLQIHFPNGYGVKVDESVDAEVIHYESASFKDFLRKFLNMSTNSVNYDLHKQPIYNFFKAHKNDIDFLEKARELFEEKILEKDIEKKKELGFAFELNRKLNEAEDIHIFDAHELEKMPYVRIKAKHANTLKNYAKELHRHKLYALSVFFIELAYTFNPWDSEIIELKDKLYMAASNTNSLNTEVKEAKKKNIFNPEHIELFLDIERDLRYYRQTEMLDTLKHILGNKEDIFEVVSQGDTHQRTLIYFDRMNSDLLSSLSAFDYFTQLFNEQDEDVKVQNYTSMLIHQGVNFVKQHNISEIADLISIYPLPPQNHSLYAQIYLVYLSHQNYGDAYKVYQAGKLHYNMSEQVLALLEPFLREYKIYEKDKRIANFQTQITNKDKRIANFQTQITNKDKRIDNLQIQVTNKDKRLKQQNRNLNIMKGKFSLYENLFSGRTGRFLKAIAYISPKSRRLLREIEKVLYK